MVHCKTRDRPTRSRFNSCAPRYLRDRGKICWEWREVTFDGLEIERRTEKKSCCCIGWARIKILRSPFLASIYRISSRVFQYWKIQVKLSEIQFCVIGLTTRKYVYDGISKYNQILYIFFYIHSYITKKIMLHDIERDVSTMENTILKENEFECF